MNPLFIGLLCGAAFVAITTEKIKKDAKEQQRKEELENKFNVDFKVTPPEQAIEDIKKTPLEEIKKPKKKKTKKD